MAKQAPKKNNQNKSRETKAKSQKSSTPMVTETMTSKWALLILLFITAIVVLQARIQLLAIPMERDEAGFAYIGHWLMKGKSLYVDMVDNKLPGLYILYGIFTTIFGYNSIGVHLGLLLANGVSAVCFFLLTRDLYNRNIAATATAFLILLLVSPDVLGFASHATQLLLPFVIGGFLLFWRGIHSGRKLLFMAAGLLLGFAFIIKQQSVVFPILAAVLWWPLRLLWNKKEGSKLPIAEWILLGVGGFLPAVFVVGYFSMTRRLSELFFWAYRQPSRMTSTFEKSSLELFQHFLPLVTKHVAMIWFFAATGLVFVFLSGYKKGAAWFGFLLAILGFASITIGAAYYQHYFILALPGVALLAAVALNWISDKIGKSGTIAIGVVAFVLIFYPIVKECDYYFHPDYNKIHQAAYAINMFPELERVGKELAKRVPTGSRIGIMGSEPEVLVAADRESCSKHIFMYPILSDPLLSPPMQNEYLHDMESCMPDYIVWNVGVLSWGNGYDKLQFFEQLMNWVEKNYTTVGIAEFRKDRPGEMVWGDALTTFKSQNDYKVYIFGKK